LSRSYSVRVRMELLVDGAVIDEDTARLLMLIERYGSILRAARSLGMAYSRAWERISKIERSLGAKIVEAKRGGRGGGGARLTPLGREIVERFLEEYRRLFGHGLEEGATVPRLFEHRPVYAGSHDIAIEKLLGRMRSAGFEVEIHWIGSVRGLASIMLDEAWIAGVHILDEGSGQYNEPIISRLGVSTRIALFRGYERLQGFAARRPMTLSEIGEGLLRGELRLVNRCWGSGTRILLDHFLKRECSRLGLDPREIPKRVRGYGDEVSTHIEVAQRIASGEADVGLTIEWAARAYGLHFVPLRWERFDIAIHVERLGTDFVKRFLEELKSREFAEELKRLPGYRVPPSMGERVI